MYIKKCKMGIMLLTACIVFLLCGFSSGCAPIENGHHHLTSMYDRNTSRECVWDFQPGLVYLELERYYGRHGNIDNSAHMNITMGSHVINIGNNVIRLEEQHCVVSTTTRLEHQLWLAFVFHERMTTLKVFSQGSSDPFVECFTFVYKKGSTFSVLAHTQSGMEQVVRRVALKPPKTMYSVPGASTTKSLHELDNRLIDIEHESDAHMLQVDKLTFLLKKHDVYISKLVGDVQKLSGGRQFMFCCVYGGILIFLLIEMTFRVTKKKKIF